MKKGDGELTFRRGTSRDVPLLARLNRQLIQDERSRTRLSLDGLKRRMRGWLKREYRAVLFEIAGRTVAYALYRLDRESPHIRQFFVARNLRRQGIGREAMRLLLSEILPPDRDVTLDVLIHNSGAHLFWKSLGFADHVVTLELQRRRPASSSSK